jgi:hypothetical protein
MLAARVEQKNGHHMGRRREGRGGVLALAVVVVAVVEVGGTG